MAVVVGTNSGFVTSAPSNDPNGSGIKLDTQTMAVKGVTLSDTTNISEIGWWCSNATEESNYEVGIYTDNGGGSTSLPSNKVGSFYTTNAKGTAAGWKKVTVDIDVSGSTTYWIAVQLDDTATQTNVDYSVTAQRRAIKTSSTNLPDPWGADQGTATNLAIAIYALEDGTPAATGTNFQINVGDSWKEVSNAYVNVGDVWKEVASASVNVGDVWKTIF